MPRRYLQLLILIAGLSLLGSLALTVPSLIAADPTKPAPVRTAPAAPATAPTNAPVAAKPAPKPPEDTYQYSFLLSKVIELIREQYVDEGKVSYKDLTYAALRGMLSSLDPHSQFLDEDSFAEMQKDTKGEFSGLGIVVGMKDGNLVVIAPMEDTPGYRAGIMPGDRILKIEGKATEKMSLLNAIKKLKGQRGEKVKLTLMHPPKTDDKDSKEKSAKTKDSKDAKEKNLGQVYEVELTRELIKVPTVRDAKLLPSDLTGDDKIGYIRLEQFGENTPQEFEDALVKLEGQGMQALVIDLRNNPGGLLDSAVEVAGKFLPSGQVVVSTQGRLAEQNYEYRARGMKKHPNYPIAVLINGYSASGSEIVAGALKDLNRAVLVGETTFGKGSVQSVQDLGNGIGLRLTTAKYYTPSKKTIHEVGVPPDIYAPISETEERGLMMARSPQLLSAEEKQEIRNLRDSQLDRAIGSLKSIRIYNQRQQQTAPATNAPAVPPATIPKS